MSTLLAHTSVYFYSGYVTSVRRKTACPTPCRARVGLVAIALSKFFYTQRLELEVLDCIFLDCIFLDCNVVYRTITFLRSGPFHSVSTVSTLFSPLILLQFPELQPFT